MMKNKNSYLDRLTPIIDQSIESLNRSVKKILYMKKLINKIKNNSLKIDQKNRKNLLVIIIKKYL